MVNWDEITAAVGVSLSGDKAAGRAALQHLWQETAERDHAQRCVIAHYLADLEHSLEDEVRWDELALDHYPHLERGDLAAIGIPDSRGLAPSLHLNLGDGYLRQGRPEVARAQLLAGQEGLNTLPPDGYGSLIRQGLEGLEKRLSAVQSPAQASPDS